MTPLYVNLYANLSEICYKQNVSLHLIVLPRSPSTEFADQVIKLKDVMGKGFGDDYSLLL